MKKEKICGIYLWTNLLNDKKYIGVSKHILVRWTAHEQNSKRGLKRKLYNATRKYGIENFKKEIIELHPEASSDEFLKEREDYFIDYYDSIKTGYNIEKGYNTISYHPEKARIIKQISNKAKNRKWINNGTEAITCDIEKINDYIKNGWKLGRLKFSKEHIKNLSESHKGHKLNENQRKAWCSGRPHSEKTKKMMSKKLMGRYSLEWYIKKYGKENGLEKFNNHHKRNKGKTWVCTETLSKQINPKEVETYLQNNWKKGRLWKNK